VATPASPRPYHFSQRYPEKRVVLLEAKALANGASGRNGGMMLNWVYGVGPMSDEMTAHVYHATHQTIDSIEQIIQTHHLDVSYRRDGCFEVFTDEQRAVEAQAEAAHLNSIGVPVQFWDAAQVRQKINLNGIYGGLFDPSEGQLNGVQFIRGLRPVLEVRGVKIYEGTAVTKITEGPTIEVTTANGSVKAKAIVLATNGYTGKLGYFRKAYFPLHSHVFATDPLSDEAARQLGWHGTAGFSDDLNRISYATRTREGHIVFWRWQQQLLRLPVEQPHRLPRHTRQRRSRLQRNAADDGPVSHGERWPAPCLSLDGNAGHHPAAQLLHGRTRRTQQRLLRAGLQRPRRDGGQHGRQSAHGHLQRQR
jgi:glycine/D-amino acid oxidase-like deaminating enzyme